MSELQDSIYAPWHVVHDPAHEPPLLSAIPPASDETVHDTIVDPTARLGLLAGLPVDEAGAPQTSNHVPSNHIPSTQVPSTHQLSTDRQSDESPEVNAGELTVVEAFDETCVMDANSLDVNKLMEEASADPPTMSDDIFKTIPQGFTLGQESSDDSADSLVESIESESHDGNRDSEEAVEHDSVGTVVDFNESELVDDAPLMDEAELLDDDELLSEVELIDNTGLTDDAPLFSDDLLNDSQLPDDEQRIDEVQLLDDEASVDEASDQLSVEELETEDTVQDTLNIDDVQLDEFTSKADDADQPVELMDDTGDSQFDTQNEFQLDTGSVYGDSQLESHEMEADSEGSEMESRELLVEGIETSDSEPVLASEGLSLGTGAESTDTESRVASKPPKRVRQTQRSGLGSLIQVILGGAAAIPVTLLLLWYVVGIDVADAGPMVAKVAPWIVPQKFRGPQLAGGRQVTPPSSMDQMMALDNATESTPGSTEPAQQTPNAEPPTATPAVTEPPVGDTQPADSNVNATSEPAQPTNPTAEPANPSATPTATTDATSVAMTPVKPVGEASQPNTVTENTQPAATPPAEQTLSNAQPVNGEVIEKLTLAKQQIKAWKTNTESGAVEVKQKFIIELLNSLATASNLAAELPEGSTMSRAVRNEFGEVGRNLVADADLEAWFRKVVYAQFNTLPRPNAGRVILMNLGDKSQEVGEAWHVSTGDALLKQLSTLPTMEIPKQLLNEVRPGQRILLFGKVFDGDVPGAPKKPVFRASFVYEL